MYTSHQIINPCILVVWDLMCLQEAILIYFADNDECMDGTDLCAANATCINTDGGYNCSCDVGYEGDGFNCTSKIVTWTYGVSTYPSMIHHAVYSLSPDIDECQIVPSLCHSDADCTDSDGSYECTCREGYSGNGTLCTGNIVLPLSDILIHLFVCFTCT